MVKLSRLMSQSFRRNIALHRDMSLNRFASPDGTPCIEGLIEQISIIFNLYAPNKSAIQAIIDASGGGKILALVDNSTNANPSYVVIQQNNAYYIVFAGTQNMRQAGNSCMGIMGQNYPEGGGDVHSLWYALWLDFQQDILNLLPSDKTKIQIFCSGHSAGGCLAVLAAIHLVGWTSPSQVSLLTFGSPRCLSSASKPNFPQTYIRVSTPNDPVVALPPTSASSWVAIISLPSSLFSSPPRWQHFGQWFELESNGGIIDKRGVRDEDTSDFDRLFKSNIAAHYSVTYFNQLANSYSFETSNEQTDSILGIMRLAILSPTLEFSSKDFLPSTYITPSNANNLYFPGKGSVINNANIEAVQQVELGIISADSRNSQRMGYYGGRQMAVASGKWNVRMFLSDGETGDVSNYVWSGTPSITDAYAKGVGLMTARSCLLGNGMPTGPASPGLLQPSIVALRISDALSPNYSQCFLTSGANTHGYSTTVGGSAPDSNSLAVVVRVKLLSSVDSQTTAWSTRDFISNPDSLYDQKAYQPATVVNGTNTWDSYFGVFLNMLTNPTNLWGAMGKSTTEKIITLTNFHRATSADLTNYPTAQLGLIIFNAATATWGDGDLISFTNANIKLFAGRYKVIKVSTGVYQIAAALPRVVICPTLAKGRLIKTAAGVTAQEFYQFQPPITGGWGSPYGIRFSSRRLAKPYVPISFRRRPGRSQ